MKKLVLSIACAMVNCQLHAGVELDFPFQKKFEIYGVGGDSIDEIEHSFDTNKFNFLKESGFDGYTEWKYDFYTSDETCEIHDFHLEVTYTLPQLAKSMTSPESTEEFRSYLEKLYRHEQSHCALAVKSMREIYLAFTDGQRGNCDKANERVIEFEGELEESNALFDVYTSHGEIELGESPFGEERYLDVCKIPFSPIQPRI